jgi:prepilin peptidase CpaA
MGYAPWIVALVLVGWAGWLDLRSRRIPNWLTVSGVAVAVGLHGLGGGWPGIKSALAGAALALGLLLPLVLLRGLGAGDWKLMGALGAFVGPKAIAIILLLTLLVAGAMAVVQVTRCRQWRQTAGNLWQLLQVSYIFGVRPHPVVSLDNPRLLTLPFGVAVAVATLLCFSAAAAWGFL